MRTTQSVKAQLAISKEEEEGVPLIRVQWLFWEGFEGFHASTILILNAGNVLKNRSLNLKGSGVAKYYTKYGI